jgi:hypothetical protein
LATQNFPDIGKRMQHIFSQSGIEDSRVLILDVDEEGSKICVE